MGGNINDGGFAVLAGRAMGDGVTKALTTTTATTAQLTVGRYMMSADTDIIYKQGPAAVSAASAFNHLPRGAFRIVQVTAAAADDYIAAKTLSGTGNLYLSGPLS